MELHGPSADTSPAFSAVPLPTAPVQPPAESHAEFRQHRRRDKTLDEFRGIWISRNVLIAASATLAVLGIGLTITAFLAFRQNAPEGIAAKPAPLPPVKVAPKVEVVKVIEEKPPPVAAAPKPKKPVVELKPLPGGPVEGPVPADPRAVKILARQLIPAEEPWPGMNVEIYSHTNDSHFISGVVHNETGKVIDRVLMRIKTDKWERIHDVKLGQAGVRDNTMGWFNIPAGEDLEVKSFRVVMVRDRWR